MQRKRPLHGKIFARCIPKRLFAGLFGCMARISCQSQLISDAWRANLATNWRFSRPRPLSGYMERKTCHGLPPGNAPRRKIATDGHLGTHRARILPRTAAHERTTAKSCRRRTLGSSSQGGFAKRLNAQGGFARRDSQEQLARHGRAPSLRGSSTHTASSLAGIRRAAREARPHARFEGQLDAQGTAARRVHEAARRAHQVRTPGSHGGFAKRLDAQGQQGIKKRRSEERRPSPHNYGRKPDPP